MKPQEDPKKPAAPAQKPNPADAEPKVFDPKQAEPKPAPRKPMISDTKLDRALEDSFPASDPPSYSPTSK